MPQVLQKYDEIVNQAIGNSKPLEQQTQTQVTSPVFSANEQLKPQETVTQPMTLVAPRVDFTQPELTSKSTNLMGDKKTLLTGTEQKPFNMSNLAQKELKPFDMSTLTKTVQKPYNYADISKPNVEQMFNTVDDATYTIDRVSNGFATIPNAIPRVLGSVGDLFTTDGGSKSRISYIDQFLTKEQKDKAELRISDYEKNKNSLNDFWNKVMSFELVKDRAAEINEKYKDKDISEGAKLVADVSVGAINMLPQTVIAMYAGGPLAMGYMFADSAAQGKMEALNNGATDDQATIYGLLKGSIEVGTEMISGGWAGVPKGKFTGLMETGLMGTLENALLKVAKTDLGKEVVSKGLDILGEGFEEYLSEVLGNYANAVYDPKRVKSFGDIQEQAIYAGVNGALTSVVMELGRVGAVKVANDVVNSNVRQVEDLSKEEQLAYTQQLLSKSGTTLVISDTYQGKDITMSSGLYDAKNKTVVIPQETYDSGNILTTSVVHEFVHSMETSKNYEMVREAILDHLDKTGRLDLLVAEKAKQYPDGTDLRGEVVADFLQDNLFKRVIKKNGEYQSYTNFADFNAFLTNMPVKNKNIFVKIAEGFLNSHTQGELTGMYDDLIKEYEQAQKSKDFNKIKELQPQLDQLFGMLDRTNNAQYFKGLELAFNSAIEYDNQNEGLQFSKKQDTTIDEGVNDLQLSEQQSYNNAKKIIEKTVKKMNDNRPILKKVHWNNELKLMEWTDSFTAIRLKQDIKELEHTTDKENYPDLERIFPKKFNEQVGVFDRVFNTALNNPSSITGLWKDMVDRKMIMPDQFTDEELKKYYSEDDKVKTKFRNKKIADAFNGNIFVKVGSNYVIAQKLNDVMNIIGNSFSIKTEGVRKPLYFKSNLGDAILMPIMIGTSDNVIDIVNKYFDVTSNLVDISVKEKTVDKKTDENHILNSVSDIPRFFQIPENIIKEKYKNIDKINDFAFDKAIELTEGLQNRNAANNLDVWYSELKNIVATNNPYNLDQDTYKAYQLLEQKAKLFRDDYIRKNGKNTILDEIKSSEELSNKEAVKVQEVIKPVETEQEIKQVKVNDPILSEGKTETEIRQYLKEQGMSENEIEKEIAQVKEDIKIEEELTKQVEPKNVKQVKQELPVEPSRSFPETIAKSGALGQAENEGTYANLTLPEKYKKDRKYAKTVDASIQKSKTFESAVKVMKDNGIFDYYTKADNTALDAGSKMIGDNPKAYYETFKNLYDNNQRITKEQSVAAQMLVEQYSKGNSKISAKMASDLYQMLTILGTESGQFTQSLGVIKKVGVLAQADLWLRIAKRYSVSSKKDVKVNQELMNELLSLAGEKQSNPKVKEINEKIANNIAEQLPVSFAEKFKAWTFLSILSKPVTDIRNMIGNSVMAGTSEIKDKVALIIEQTLPKEKRTKSFSVSKETKTFVKELLKDYRDVAISGSAMDMERGLANRRQIFKKSFFEYGIEKLSGGKVVLNKSVLETIRQGRFGLLEYEDTIFKTLAFKRSVGQYLDAKGLTKENITDKQLKEAIEYGAKVAQQRTFQQANWIATKLNEMQKHNVYTEVIFQSTTPFKKTPLNIIKTGGEYSGIGLVGSLVVGSNNVKKGKWTAADFIDKMSAGLTGTGISLIGFLMFNAGMITAGDDDEESAKLNKMNQSLGMNDYSLHIGDKYYSIDWIAPAIIPFMMGAEIARAMNKGFEGNPEDILLEVTAKVFDPAFELTMLKGITDTLSSYEKDGVGKISGMLSTIASNYALQVFPNILGSVAKIIDPTIRTSYTSGGMFEQTLNKIANKIPFISGMVNNPVINIKGEEVKQSGDVWIRSINNLINPSIISEDISSPVDDEIRRLYKETGDGGVIPSMAPSSIMYGDETYKLDQDAKTDYAKLLGNTTYNMLEKATTNDVYKSLDDDTKADVVSAVYDYARSVAKDAYFSSIGVSYTNNSYEKANEAISNGIELDEYLIMKNKFDTITSDSDFSKKENIIAQLVFSGYSDADIYKYLVYVADYKYSADDQEYIDILRSVE